MFRNFTPCGRDVLTAAAVAAVACMLSCGYRQLIMPAPKTIHKGDPLPLRLAVSVPKTQAMKHAMAGFFSSSMQESVSGFYAAYFRQTRLFASVGAALPGDAEIYINLTGFRPVVSETPLRSQENYVEVDAEVEYKCFLRALPDLVVSGTASGHGRSSSAGPLTVGNYQMAFSQALDDTGASIDKKVSAALLPRSAEIAAWAQANGAPTPGEAGGKAKAAKQKEKKKGEGAAEEGEWEEVKPKEQPQKI